MGYACPVCEATQADGEHLANHLAFTAMLHGDEHAAFLDATIDGWEDRTPPELAAELIRHADEVVFDAAFEDTTETPGIGDPSGRAAPLDDVTDVDALAVDALDEETERVIEEARALFRAGDEEK